VNAIETEALMHAYRKRMAERSRADVGAAIFWLGCVALPAAIALAWLDFLR
jgi:hypothetical protein